MSQNLRTFCLSKYFALNGFFSCSCKRGLAAQLGLARQLGSAHVGSRIGSAWYGFIWCLNLLILAQLGALFWALFGSAKLWRRPQGSCETGKKRWSTDQSLVRVNISTWPFFWSRNVVFTRFQACNRLCNRFKLPPFCSQPVAARAGCQQRPECWRTEGLDFCTGSHKSSSFTRRTSRTSNNPVPVCAFLPNMVGWADHWTRATWTNCVRSYKPGSKGDPIFSTTFFSEPLKLLLLALGSGLGSAWVGARLGSAPDRCLAWLVARFSARDRDSARLGSWLGSVCSRTGSAQDSAHRSPARLETGDSARSGSWLGSVCSGSACYSELGSSRLLARTRLGVPLGVGTQLNARLGSARV